MSIQRQVRSMRRYANDLDMDDLLELIGLQRRRTAWAYVLPVMGVVGAGMLVGAGLGLLFAPTPGRLMRREAGSKVKEVKERIRGAAERAAEASST
jgi:hypothetical protein